MATLLWVVTGNEQNDIHTLSHDIYIYYRNVPFQHSQDDEWDRFW